MENTAASGTLSYNTKAMKFTIQKESIFQINSKVRQLELETHHHMKTHTLRIFICKLIYNKHLTLSHIILKARCKLHMHILEHAHTNIYSVIHTHIPEQ